MPSSHTQPSFLPIHPAKLRWREAQPYSTVFEDSYCCSHNGLAKSHHVFIEGNRLKPRFSSMAEQTSFVVAETGFGTGLNFLACCETFLQYAPESATLHFISVEKYPLRADDLARALQRWTTLAPLAAQLLNAYPALCPGFHRRHLAGGRVVLTLMFGDAAQMLSYCDARVDAWFLDGFTPARNPDMWSQNVFDQLRRLSHSNTSLATIISADAVQHGLSQAGFTLQNTQGHGSRWGVLPGKFEPAGELATATQYKPRVAVIGAGLAGCSTAAALARHGAQISLFDPAGVANGASGNLAGVVYTSASAHFTPQNRFYQSSYLFSLAMMRELGFPRDADDGALSGVMQLPKDDQAAAKAQQAVASGYWPGDILYAHDDTRSIVLPTGGYVSPARWCAFLLERFALTVSTHKVLSFVRSATGWELQLDISPPLEFDQVVICTAASATDLLNLDWMKLKSIRGQVSHIAATPASQHWQLAICHGGYLSPAMQGLHCVGATFDMHDNDEQLRPQDNQRNLEQLRQYLPDHWKGLGGENIEVVSARVGFRCQSTDFLPLAGPLAEADSALAGLWLNVAHGSRGISGTPLCAELIASEMFAQPLPVDEQLRQALAPARFLKRKQKGGRKG